MSGGWRTAMEWELPKLWPAVRTSRAAHSPEDLAELYRAAPWRLRVSSSGDAMLLSRWRDHLDVLALRGAWVVPHRVASLVSEARAVAAAQGFATLLSPLLSASSLRPYAEAGMEPGEAIVAYQGLPGRIAMVAGPPALPVRPAVRSDLDALLEIDSAGFDEFWRYGVPELEDALKNERVTVAEKDGSLVGYASCSLSWGTCTLARLAVSPDVRRSGAATSLVSESASWASRSGATVYSLCTQEANEASRGLYRSLRLTEVEERYSLAIAPSGHLA